MFGPPLPQDPEAQPRQNPPVDTYGPENWPTEWSLQNVLIAWNDYLYQYLLLPASSEDATVAVGIAEYLDSDEEPWNDLMAAAILYALPPVVIFYGLRRYMAAGLTLGALKG